MSGSLDLALYCKSCLQSMKGTITRDISAGNCGMVLIGLCRGAVLLNKSNAINLCRCALSPSYLIAGWGVMRGRFAIRRINPEAVAEHSIKNVHTAAETLHGGSIATYDPNIAIPSLSRLVMSDLDLERGGLGAKRGRQLSFRLSRTTSPSNITLQSQTLELCKLYYSPIAIRFGKSP
jgi:hypothetical protein